MSWFFAHLNRLGVKQGEFFERACYGGCKNKCLYLIEKLVVKIPISKLYLSFKTIFQLKNSFKDEKAMLVANYLINKLK